MFKNLLDPNSEKALSKALETLDQTVADQRQALVHLIISNQDKLAENPLIDQITDLSTLFELHKQSESKLKQQIENLLSHGLSPDFLAANVKQNTKAQELLSKSINTNQHDIIYTIASLSECPTLSEQALSKISLSKQEQLLEEAKSETTKAILIKNITNIETLKRLEKEHRGKDKKTFRYLQEQIEKLEKLNAQKTTLIEKSSKILESIIKLSQSTYAPLYDSKFLHLETAWKDIQSEISASVFTIDEILEKDSLAKFSNAATQCQKAINQVLEAERNQQEKEQSQAFLEKSLFNLKAFLSTESIDIDACKQLISSIHQKLEKAGDPLTIDNFDSNTFKDFETSFKFHEAFILRSAELAEFDLQLEELSTLFSSNHKKKKAEDKTLQLIKEQKNKLNEFKKTLPKINESLDFEVPALKALNNKITTIKNLEKQCFDMQNEFQAKFEKKLGYIKTELENKAIGTVNRLCREAQELLPLCPLKQQEKLQKRLDAHKEDLVKLEDWFNFATLPKRKELCEKMDELAKNASRSKIKILKEDIRILQQSWKELGHARDAEGEALWVKFQEAGNLAYQPIKDLLDRKENEKQKNLEAREQILEKLNKHIETYSDNSPQNIDSSSSEKLLRQSQSNWTKAFPIPSGHKELQEKFDRKIIELDDKLKPARSINLGKKKNLLMLAEKLVGMENNNEAIEQAKKLQLDWKEVGYCEQDEELWKQFRTFCDQIFEARNSIRDEQKEKEQKSINEAKALCKAIESIDTDDINQFESELRKLCSQFEDIKNLPKQRKDLPNNFIKAKKSAQTRLNELKKIKKSKAFQNIIHICEKLGSIEKEIMDTTINEEDVLLKAEAIFSQFDCSEDTKEKLKSSLLILHKESKSNLPPFITQQKNLLMQLCVELEIELDIDSPPQDKSLRMELQVKRLNKKFNQSEKLLSIPDKILSAFYLGGLFSFQDKSYVSRLIAMQEKATK